MPLAAAEPSRPLQIVGGRVDYGPATVLADVDFQVDAGEFVVLLGENGSGKTTLVKALLGLVPLTEGSVHLFGRPVDDFKHRELIGYVPQRGSAASGVPASAKEVVLSGRVARSGFLRRFSKDDVAASERALAAVDLSGSAGAPVARLSGGQQQRVLIARALAGEPQILVLDEPVASVDLAHQESFAEILMGLKERGTAVLLVAHSLGALRPLVDRAVVLKLGRVAYSGPPVSAEEEHDHHHHPAEGGGPSI
jgi:zinc transport system ATP-binding protein